MSKRVEYARLIPSFLARYRLLVKGGIDAGGRNDVPLGLDRQLLESLESLLETLETLLETF